MAIRLLVALMALIGTRAVALDAVDYNNLGIRAYDAGDFEEAIANFEEAYAAAPTNETVRENLCRARQGAANELALAGDFDTAIKHLEVALTLTPTNAQPLVQLGSYYLRQGMVKDAIFRLEEAIELQAGYLDAHELLGLAYYRDNDLPSARAQWDYVLEVQPNRPGLRERYDKAFREEQVEGDFHRSGSRHFKVSYPREMPFSVRSRVLNLLERAYLDIGRKFSGVYPPDTIQVIVYDSERFSKATELGAHVGALYDGKIRVPLTDDKGAFLNDDELKRRLYHEYVHVVIRHVADDKAPWWVNEGLAEAFSRDLDPEEQVLLEETYRQQQAFSLADLEGQQLDVLSPERLRLAYAQAHAAMDQLWDRHGQQRLRDFINQIAAGIPTEEALKRVYRKNYEILDKEIAARYH